MFDSLLVANRGEIACRVLRTARRLGLRTVAVYSEADRDALHVRQADEAVEIGPAPASASYLVIAALIDAARRTGAEAIHPGYGFLSENADFAQACAEAGLCFVGPSPAAIAAMGLKDAAKRAMEHAGVPVVPGYHGQAQSPVRLRSEAARIGFPVLIKAVAGGGGKGMRRVETVDAFDEALEAAQREAQAAFGDARVLIEKYLTRPRHIEVQVFADRHGQAVHLFERDCSLQRRHQKVLEEAPAPGVDDAMRQAMGEAAVRAARSIGYEGAGTCEFIVDVAGGVAGAPFFFMEMNTRLQVEHPVTEAISGHDLVEWQLRVAAGEPLPCAQDELAIQGHAIEARLYAEDPSRDYLPQTGVLQHVRWPTGAGIRVDTGVRAGDAVTVHYDPLLAKLLAHGDTREQARRRLVRALSRLSLFGVTTNLPLLAEALDHPAFIQADLDTGFLSRHAATLLATSPERERTALMMACLAERLVRSKAASTSRCPWSTTDGFELSLPPREAMHWVIRERDVCVALEGTDEALQLSWDDQRVWARGARLDAHTLSVSLDGELQRAGVFSDMRGWAVRLEAHAVHVARTAVERDADEDAGVAGALTAPMPGKVVAVLVKTSEHVQRGQALVRLEAMKMEHTLVAGADAQVEAIRVRDGDQVAEGAVLLTLVEPD